MPKPGKSAKGSSAKSGTMMPNSKMSASSIKGGAPPQVMTSKHGSGLIAGAKKGC